MSGSAATAMTLLNARLADGGVVVLDGGTGTELEKRGGQMHGEVWCAAATLTHGEVLQGLHEDYIRAGADIITANTFSANLNMLGPAGLGERFADINIGAVALAKAARAALDAQSRVVVAGSISHQNPVSVGTDKRDISKVVTPAQAAESAQQQVEYLVEAGAELLLLEMMSDPNLAVPTVAAACKSGLPVWVGLSAKSNAEEELRAYHRKDLSFAQVAREILTDDVAACGIMHTSVNLIEPALAQLREFWDKPLMAYPDSGFFTMPHWQFVDIIEPAPLTAVAERWVKDFDVQVVGGCCGLGPAHIADISATFKS